ncbi:unnamed protein product [Brassicogethes aeneus]|nr:unnamed protein product [Brassicogethes aeneus]
MLAFSFLVTLVTLLILEIQGASKFKNEDSLVLVHVLFRHGNRTAHGKSELYPKDPYYNKTYFPIGLGQLTRAGKLKEYSIGTQLRKRYNDFLGQEIYPQLVDARSTEYNRTKASLLLCLAGLFPPTTMDLFENSLSLQAIPTNYWPINSDPELAGYRCPNYIKMYDDNKYKPNNQKLYDDHRDIFQYISDNSGLNITSFEQIYHLYFGISTEIEFGLDQPQWIKNIWPHPIVDLSVKQYYVATDTVDMKRILTGHLLKKIVDDSMVKINEDPDEEFKTKMYLYSGHEDNIANFLITLNVFDDKIPNYGSYVLVELHKIDNEFGLKFFYHNYETGNPVALNLPSCGGFCTLKNFISLYKVYFPLENSCRNSTK